MRKKECWLSLLITSGIFALQMQGIWLPSNVAHEVTTLTECDLSSLYIDNLETPSLDNYAHMVQVSGLLKMLIVEAVKFSDIYDWQGTQGRHFRLIRDLIGTAV
jgi:hypothetical protein